MGSISPLLYETRGIPGLPRGGTLVPQPRCSQQPSVNPRASPLERRGSTAVLREAGGQRAARVLRAAGALWACRDSHLAGHSFLRKVTAGMNVRE